MFELELVGPNDDGPPDDLIQEDDDGNHCGHSPKNRASVAAARGRLQERTKTGKPEVALAQDKHFASHQKEPPTRDGHHGIPHQTDRGKRKVKLREALPAAKTIDDRGFVKFARDTLQRGVKTERNVPDLSRKDEQDGAEFHAELAVRKNRNHGQHDSR